MGRSSRNYEVDLLRVLAAIFIVAFHVGFGNFVLHFNPVRYPDWLSEAGRYGAVAVPVFFFISGLVILPSAFGRSAKQFAVARMARLYPAYWVCVTLTFLLVTVAGTRHIPISDYLVNLTLLEGFLFHPLVDAVYWTLEVELIFYGVVWLTLLANQIKNLSRVLWAWLALAAVTTAIQVAGVTVPNRIVVATAYTPYIVFGAAVAMYLRGDKSRSVTTQIVVAGVLSVFRQYFDAKALKAMYPALDVRISLTVFVIVMAFCLAIAFGVFHRIGRPWMAFAGALTYPVYLLHDEFTNVLMRRWDTMNRWLLLAVVLGIVVAVSWAVQHFVERPGVPWLKRTLNQLWERAAAWRATLGTGAGVAATALASSAPTAPMSEGPLAHPAGAGAGAGAEGPPGGAVAAP